MWYDKHAEGWHEVQRKEGKIYLWNPVLPALVKWWACRITLKLMLSVRCTSFLCWVHLGNDLGICSRSRRSWRKFKVFFYLEIKQNMKFRKKNPSIMDYPKCKTWNNLIANQIFINWQPEITLQLLKKSQKTSPHHEMQQSQDDNNWCPPDELSHLKENKWFQIMLLQCP